MFPTLEVRWFYQGDVPMAVLDWFQKVVPGSMVQLARTDYYLHIPDTNSLSIKLREGRIEIKQRQTQHGRRQFHDRVSGLVEGWRKWGMVVEGGSTNLDLVVKPTSSWLAVRKERLLGKYQINAHGDIDAVPIGQMVDFGCEIELSTIRMNNIEWWTLAFEAFGLDTSLDQNLTQVAECVFQSQPPPVFSLENSFGYPKWLSTIPG